MTVHVSLFCLCDVAARTGFAFNGFVVRLHVFAVSCEINFYNSWWDSWDALLEVSTSVEGTLALGAVVIIGGLCC
jgi:hypothetical protein